MTKSSMLRKALSQDLLTFWIIGTCSICAGLLLNQFREKPLPLVHLSKEERLQQAVEKIAVTAVQENTILTEKLPQELSLKAFCAFVEGKQGVVLDARPEIFHRLGHVPGALSLPREAFEESYAKIKERLETDKNQPIVVYCSGSSCEDSKLVNQALLSLGYSRIAVFTGGWAAWTGAGLAEETVQ